VRTEIEDAERRIRLHDLHLFGVFVQEVTVRKQQVCHQDSSPLRRVLPAAETRPLRRYERVREAAQVHFCFCTQAPSRGRGSIGIRKRMNRMSRQERPCSHFSVQCIAESVVEDIVVAGYVDSAEVVAVSPIGACFPTALELARKSQYREEDRK